MREHFACDSAPGAELEGDGGSGIAENHWEERIFAVSSPTCHVLWLVHCHSLQSKQLVRTYVLYNRVYLITVYTVQLYVLYDCVYLITVCTVQLCVLHDCWKFEI